MSTQFEEIPCPDSFRPSMSMSGEEWPPQWKPIEESPEYFLMCGYLKVLDFEIDPSLYPFHGQFPIDKYLMFLKEVRESRGYDVTVDAPGTGFCPVDDLLMEDSERWYNELCGFVVDKINDQAKMYGELYVYHSLVKVVEIYSSRTTLFTFDVKEVESNDLKSVQACIYCRTYNLIHIHGWRFKPSFKPKELDDHNKE